jgi:hypothetical protein
MRAVDKAAFYARVGPLNVHATIQPGGWPYTSLWKLADGRTVVGKSVGKRDGSHDYFLKDAP